MSAYQNFTGMPALPVELDFSPVREPVMWNGNIVPDQYWWINPLTDQLLSDKPSGKNHQCPSFAVMYDAICAGVEASGLDVSNIQAKFNVASRGAAFSLDILFKKYTYDSIVGEATSMKMRIIDSHDMTFRRHIQAMIMRLACTNGMSAVGERLLIKQKHTLLSDPEKLGAVVSQYPVRLEAEAGLYKHMMATRVSKDEAIQFARDELASYRTVSGVKTNEKSVEEFARIWNSYAGLGETGYRLYNVLTHIGTHVTGREGTDLARKQIRIEDRVADIVQLPRFRQLTGLPLAA